MATTTPKNGLPLIDSSMTADVPRDLNALAHAVDSLIGDMDSVPTASKEVAGAITELRQDIQAIDPTPVDGSITDVKIGTRTITDASAPTSDTGAPTALWGWLAYILKSLMGTSNWRTLPSMTISAIITALGLKAPLASPVFTGTATAPTFKSTASDGTAPISVTSKTQVPNLNADMVDGVHASSFARVDQNIVMGNNLAIQVAPSASNKFIANGGSWISGGADSGNSITDANLRLHSWFGIAFSPSISGQAVPQGENATWFDIRNGIIYTRGEIYAQSNKRVRHDGNFVVSSAAPSGGIDGDIWIQY